MAIELETDEEREAGRGGDGAGGMFRALSHRNFRLFWAGAFLSNTGTWMQAVAQGWLVYQLTNSAFWLGVDAFMSTAPGLILTLLAGVFADLVDRRRLLLFTQVGAGLSALVLAVLIVTNVVHVWMILVLSFVTGCCFAIAGPSYQAITIDLVGREDLANAIALNSTQFQFSRVMGPVLAGVGLKLFGLAGCFFVNAFSFVAVITALSMVRFDERKALAPAHSVKDRKAVWQDLVEGLRYVRQRPRVFMLLLISGMTSLFGAPFGSMIPLYARDIFFLDESGNALLMGFSGAGAFVGALFLAYLGDFKYKGWSVLCGAFGFALFLIGFSFSTNLTISLGFLFGMGVAIVSCVAVINTLLQKLVTDEMRGRVMSMWLLTIIGTMPVGSFLSGAAADRFGPRPTLAACGIVVLLFGLIAGLRNPRLREM